MLADGVRKDKDLFDQRLEARHAHKLGLRRSVDAAAIGARDPQLMSGRDEAIVRLACRLK